MFLYIIDAEAIPQLSCFTVRKKKRKKLDLAKKLVQFPQMPNNKFGSSFLQILEQKGQQFNKKLKIKMEKWES